VRARLFFSPDVPGRARREPHDCFIYRLELDP